MRQNQVMTKGKILEQIVMFALPLLAGNVLQQLYSTVDSIICGNFIGSIALAAIGSSGSIIDLMIGTFMGFSSGVSILVGQYTGAGKKERIVDLLHNAMWICAVLGVLFTVVGIVWMESILQMIHVPAQVFDSSVTYLRIYFLGMLFVIIYNMCAGILRGSGDSKTPLYLLGVTSCINIILDLVLILVFHMGIAGAAIATIVAQGVSAILALVALKKAHPEFSLMKTTFEWALQKEIFRLSIPGALAGVVIDFSNVLVQSYINFFGASASAGVNVYFRFDQFILMPSKSFGYAIETFVAQNLGAKEYPRIHEGIRTTLRLSVTIILAISVLSYLVGPYVLTIFNQELDVLYYGTYMLRHLSLFYVVLNVNHVLGGALRGVGKTLSTVVINIFGMCIIRQIILYFGMKYTQNIQIIYWGYGYTWIVCALLTTIYIKSIRIESIDVK